MDFLGMGPLELLVILVVALIFLGPQRMVQAATRLGKVVREFRKASSQLTEEITRELAIDEPKKLLAKPAPSASVARTPTPRSESEPQKTLSRKQAAVPAPPPEPKAPSEAKR
ncbi:MAG: twin-arginine translocase TatA/TatE family subunit [Chloroflexi bacterium]|nr:twin-arginine translocase TatA/TatE family subunit [Chloroflexota bacterium]